MVQKFRIKMKISTKKVRILLCSSCLLIHLLSFSQLDEAPRVFATGNKAFCPNTDVRIVDTFSIIHSSLTTLPAIYIQISEGYELNFDQLSLDGNHPNVNSVWIQQKGRLNLFSNTPNTEMTFSDIENAVNDVIFSTTSRNPTQRKYFSISIDNANFLPLTGHFYEFIEAERITWTDAKVAAEARTYYGRKGYLATLTSQEEADFAGKQTTGTGWIGASDAENEGEWKWVTGPEAGTVFWRGQISGTTPNFAFWNNNEPNNFTFENPNGEHYAHITDPTVPNVIIGSWNDLPNEGGTGLFIPKGYIVEYGSPTEPPLSIVTSTSIYIPQVTTSADVEICEFGTTTLTASSIEGDILWFNTDSPNDNIPIATGNRYEVSLTETRTFYAAVSINGCVSLEREPITVTVNQRPSITNVTNGSICSGTAVLSASASAGDVYWYETDTSSTPIHIGANFETSTLNSTRSYFVEANISGCNSLTRTEVIAEVNDAIPQFDFAQSEFILCKDIGRVTLETINAQDNYRYIWKKDGNNITGDLGSLEVTETGTYAVSAVSQSGCVSPEQFVNVRESEKTNITKDDVEIIDDSDNNSIRIITSDLGIGSYEFALDNINGTYQSAPFFENLSTGIHTLYIRDIGGCGIQGYQFSILSYPKFFTPNGDNQNDFWQINGYDSTFYTTATIYIYNRFGNLIYTLTQNSQGWDGNYGGKKLPENTYWFRVILTDINGYSIEKFGNISLIR